MHYQKQYISCRFDNIKHYIPCQNKTRYTGTCVWQYFLTGVIGFKVSKPCMSSLCLILYLIVLIFLVDVVPSNPNTSFQQHKTGFYTCPVWERKQIPEVILGLIFLSVMKLRAFICNQSIIFLCWEIWIRNICVAWYIHVYSWSLCLVMRST